jgi:hypothetical protein
MTIKNKDIIEIQNKIRHGQIAITRDDETGDTVEFRYDGIASYDCPHFYCELHPRRDKKNPCKGFMRWINTTTGKVEESCPWLGGTDFTIGIKNKVISWKKVTLHPVTKEQEEKIVSVKDL